MQSIILGFVSIAIFSMVYFVDFKFLDRVNDANLTSFAAGVGAVYVFIHMLPQLAHGQVVIENVLQNTQFFGSQFMIYVIALAGFIFFYFFDRILLYTDRLPTAEYREMWERSIYWTNVIFITSYNMLIGYVVGSYNLNNVSYQLMYLIAYVLHFITLKWGIYHISPDLYRKKARYPIALGLFLGYFIAFTFDISELVFVIIEAFVTGAMILSVFKHELPNEQDSKGRSFIAGIALSLILFMSI